MDVDLEGALPFVITDIREILERGLVGRVVEEDIDPAELIDSTFNDGAAVIWLSQVSGPNRPSARACALSLKVSGRGSVPVYTTFRTLASW